MSALKVLQLTVSKSFKIPGLLQGDDPCTNEDVLQLGCRNYEVRQAMVHQDLQTEEVKSIVTKHNEERQSWEHRLKHECTSWEAKISDMIKKITTLEEERNLLTTKLQTLQSKSEAAAELNQEKWDKIYQKGRQYGQEEYKAVVDVLQERVRAQEQSQGDISQIRNKVKLVANRLSTGPSSFIGNVGESIVEQYISETFSGPYYKIVDVSHVPNSADRIFSSSSMKCIIETKNVSRLKTTDVEKFHNDIRVGVQRSQINAALLVSLLDTHLIDGHKGFYFEIREGIPVIYIGNAVERMFAIKMALLTLQYLVDNGVVTNIVEEDSDSEQRRHAILTEALSKLYNHV